MSSTTTTSEMYNVNQLVEGGNQGPYRIISKISAGGYGAVYRVRRTQGEHAYAMKIERREPNRDHFKLIMEVRVLGAARREGLRRHFPELIDYHRKEDRMWVVMTLLGESLADLKRRRPARTFSPNTGYYAAVQTLDAIAELHKLGYIHRDIKPANFVIGRRGTSDFNNVYIVDFGIARNFLDEQGHVKTPRQKTRFKGTVRFAPLATHTQEELGRKDDIESWLYMIIDLVNASRLPWHQSEDRKEVEEMKRQVRAAPAAVFNDRQRELVDVLGYLQKQHYVNMLDYDWIKHMVKRVAKREGVDLTPPYDWQIERD